MATKVDLSDKSVLLIDSSGNLRSTVKTMLQSMGFGSVTTLSIAPRVLDDIADNDYDIVLLGHNVNDKYSGLQLFEEARYKGLIKPTCSWVLMSSDASQQSVLFAIEIEPDELLTKPFTLDALSRRIQSLCQRRALLEPIERAVERKAFNRAIRLCDTVLRASDPNYQQAQLIKGRLLKDQQRYSEARDVFERCYSDSGGLYSGYQLAECHYHLGDFDIAEKLLTTLIDKHRLLIPAYDLLAKVSEARGDLQQAQQQLRKGASQSPLSIQRQMELGRLSVRANDLSQAEKAYRRCIHLGESSCLDSATPYFKLVNVQRLQVEASQGHERQDRLDDIEKLLERADTRFHRDPQVRVQSQLIRAKVNETLGDADSAQHCYERALAHAESYGLSVDLEQMRAQLLDESTPAMPGPVLQESEPEPTKTKHDPAMSAKVNRIGVRNYLADKPGQAIRYFGLAFDYDPSNARALLNLSQLFLEAARDTPSKRDERMKMFQRYSRLAQRLPLAGDELHKDQQLRKLAELPLEQLPEGPLAALLK
ncbi:tetratricopeptide repeat protein [Motiliproteus coralliicola]|uniref:tetratricopeptide repeat protein n=1 Tax=Motiliproteus coralliicola TaxID=2283196 RepID=UPI001403026A|nr:response regulator [Motiliproteus coralliicola]